MKFGFRKPSLKKGYRPEPASNARWFNGAALKCPEVTGFSEILKRLFITRSTIKLPLMLWQ